jgi:hypothetical protein
MIKKYRDVVRLTLFGRHDKNSGDATSIYCGYDRAGVIVIPNTKRVKFDLNQEFSTLRLADGAVIFLEYARKPTYANAISCYKNLRVCGAENVNTFDSVQGSSGNPILFTCDSGFAAANFYLSNTEYSRVQVPPNYLNKGFIEFELETVFTGNPGAVNIYNQAQLNELIIKVVIAEPDITLTQDVNLAPEYKSANDFYKVRTFNKVPLNH